MFLAKALVDTIAFRLDMGALSQGRKAQHGTYHTGVSMAFLGQRAGLASCPPDCCNTVLLWRGPVHMHSMNTVNHNCAPDDLYYT
jgi:hypothetical protein